MRIRYLFFSLLAVALGVGGAFLWSCSDRQQEGATRGDIRSSCPSTLPAGEVLPRVAPEERTLGYWLKRVAEQGDPDEVLLTPEEIKIHNAAFARKGDGSGLGPRDLLAPIEEEALLKEVNDRLAWLEEQFRTGKYVSASGGPISQQSREMLGMYASLAPLTPELRVAVGHVQLRCAPFQEKFYTTSLDYRFNRNNCSAARPQEVIQILRPWRNGMFLARTPYAMGWIDADAPLSPVLSDSMAQAFLKGPKALVVGQNEVRSVGDDRAAIPERTILPLVPGYRDRLYFATREGFYMTTPLPKEHLIPTERPLTRRAFLEEAFAYLGTPYGWGGEGGGRDCSRFLLDLFASFGLFLPRHTADQARAGTFSIEVPPSLGENDRKLLIDSAAERGIVLLHFPGHIMLYLGRNERGVPMVIHSFAEYVVPCDGEHASEGTPAETLYTVDRINISDLELGRGSSRTSFIERLTRITVFGQPPGLALAGAAQLRPAAEVEIPRECKGGEAAGFFVSPETPNAGQPLRIIATRSKDPGPVALTLIDPKGERHTPALRTLGGPPFSYVTTIEAPAAGRWKAVLGDGSRVLACTRFTVQSRAPKAKERSEGPVWKVKRRWNEATENLYSAFVESLFDYPPDEDLTWPSMHALLQVPEKNLLYNHLSQNEEQELRLEPDCADLSYLLRAYFAWKMGLPYGFRECSRGKAGGPPKCEELITNLTEREHENDAKAFLLFANRQIRSGVHSGNGRTLPGDDETDYYPVPLNRESLRPGTLFADPYGHLLVVARWLPQGLDSYGVLIGADAQPDATVGRRRFWRGTFLFTPETKDVGAGFKAHRPLVYRRGEIVALKNKELDGRYGAPPYSEEQYQGSLDDFYEKMEALINPRPLDPETVLLSLVDALEESVVRRVSSVDNGEKYMADHGFAPIEMPKGLSIFLTSGPWEDFSTPSRDMRLLIAIDTVMNFPEVLQRFPARFGLEEGEALEVQYQQIKERLSQELASRNFSYTRSDGSSFTLTLQDIASRQVAFEMAYNPNDCVEIRWGAPEGSDEISTCKRRAPAFQKEEMESYRPWFQSRQRPAR